MSETRIDIVRRCVAEERPLQVGVEWVRELAEEIDALPRPAQPSGEPVASHWSVIRFAFNEAMRAAAKGYGHEEESAMLDELARNLDDNIREHSHPSAAAGAEVAELDEWRVVDKDGRTYQTYETEAAATGQPTRVFCAMLDKRLPDRAPHRVMRVCLKSVEAE